MLKRVVLDTPYREELYIYAAYPPTTTMPARPANTKGCSENTFDLAYTRQHYRVRKPHTHTLPAQVLHTLTFLLAPEANERAKVNADGAAVRRRAGLGRDRTTLACVDDRPECVRVAWRADTVQRRVAGTADAPKRRAHTA